MNSNVIYIIDDVQELQLEPEKLETENNNMYRIVGIIDDYYIVNTRKERIKKTEGPELSSGAIQSDKKNVRDEIKIENL